MSFCDFLTSKRKLHKVEQFSKNEMKFLTRRIKNGKSDFYQGGLTKFCSLKNFEPKSTLFFNALIAFSVFSSSLFLFFKSFWVPYGFYKFIFWTPILIGAWYGYYKISLGFYKDILPKINMISFYEFVNSINKVKFSKFMKILNKVLEEKYDFKMPKCVGAYILFYDNMETERSKAFFEFYMRKADIKNASFEAVKADVKARLEANGKQEETGTSFYNNGGHQED